MRVIIIDNFDSFTYNLADLVRRATRRIETTPSFLTVVRNDRITKKEVFDLHPTHLIFSPGPGNHRAGGVCHELLEAMCGSVPTLGVCLGHQLIACSSGASIVRAPKPVHGHRSSINHTGHHLFQNIPTRFQGCRYHSLVVERSSLPKEVQLIAESDEGLVMAIAHTKSPMFGVQFHPESFLSEYGVALMQNFLKVLP